jgi:hypothetical protein
MSDDSNQVYTTKQMLSLRCNSNEEQNEAYIFFCERFLKCIVGKINFNKKLKLNMKLSEIATPSDEALGLLLLENNEVKWLSELQNQEDKSAGEEREAPSITKPKYTSGGKAKGTRKGLTRRYGGWKMDGIKRFNALLMMVKEDRAKNGKWFDKIMMERLDVGSKKKKDLEEEDGEVWVKAGNDLFDDDDDVEVSCERGEEEEDLEGGLEKENEDEDHGGDVNEDENGDHGWVEHREEV